MPLALVKRYSTKVCEGEFCDSFATHPCVRERGSSHDACSVRGEEVRCCLECRAGRDDVVDEDEVSSRHASTRVQGELGRVAHAFGSVKTDLAGAAA